MFDGLTAKLISAGNSQWWLKNMLQLGKITEIQTSVKLEMSLHIWGSCNSCLHSAFSLGWGWHFEVSLHSGFSHLKWFFQITRGNSKLSRSCEIHFPATLEKWALSIFFLLWCGTCGMIWEELCSGASCLWSLQNCQCISEVRALVLLTRFCPQKYPPFFLSLPIYWVSNKFKTCFLLKEGFYFCEVIFCVVGGSLLNMLISWKDKVTLENFRRELIAAN